MLSMHLSQWTTNQETHMVTICTFIYDSPLLSYISNDVFKASWVISWSTGLIPATPGSGVCSVGPPLYSEGPSPTGRLDTKQLDPTTVGDFCIASKVGVQKRSLCGDKRSSSQLLRASGQSRGFQVTLEFSHCTSVQGTKVEVKRGVCDVEVSSLFDEVHNLEKTERTAGKHKMHFMPFKSAIMAPCWHFICK